MFEVYIDLLQIVDICQRYRYIRMYVELKTTVIPLYSMAENATTIQYMN